MANLKKIQIVSLRVDQKTRFEALFSNFSNLIFLQLWQSLFWGPLFWTNPAVVSTAVLMQIFWLRSTLQPGDVGFAPGDGWMDGI